MWRVVMRRPLSSDEQENEAKLIPGRVLGKTHACRFPVERAALAAEFEVEIPE